MVSHSYNALIVNGTKVVPRKRTDIISWQGKRITVDEYLRLWIQAAVDNAKYGLLQQWGYTKPIEDFGPSGQDRLVMSLFEVESPAGNYPLSYTKDERGEANLELYKGIKLITNNYKLAASIRKGGNFIQKKFSLSETIVKSSEFVKFLNYHFNEDPNEFTFNKNFHITNEDGTIVVTSDVKNNTLTPLEMVAVIPAVEFKIMKNKYGDTGLLNGPTLLHSNVYKNAHFDAMKVMNSRHESILKDARNKDIQSGFIGKSEASLETQVELGKAYYKDMMKWYTRVMFPKNTRSTIEKMPPNIFERSPDFIDFAELNS